MDSREIAVYNALNELNIAYERFEHLAAATMKDCERFDEDKGAAHCKNLFLTNRQGTRFYLLLVVGDKPFKTKDISGQLGVSRLSFGNEEQLLRVLGLSPGAVTPMGLINDVGRDVRVLLDRDVAMWDRVIVHPNVNTASIILNTSDLIRFIEARGNRMDYVSVQTAAQSDN